MTTTSMNSTTTPVPAAPAARRPRRSPRIPALISITTICLLSGSSSNTGRRTLGGSNASNGKVVNIHTTAQMQVVLVKPDRFDNVSDIAEHLRSKHAVVLNLESTNKDVARRLVDFLSGCAYALDGKIKKIAISTYIITPYNVDIVGDLIDELENNGVYL